MAVLISGKLIGPNGDPRPGVTIMLTAVKTSSAVVHLAPSSSTTGPDGSYSLSVEVGTHNVMIEAYGRPFEKVGQITVYSDSKPGTLNDFLTSPGQEELTPAIVAMVDDMRAAAALYADLAKGYASDAKASSEVAQSGVDPYDDAPAAQRAIDNGTETRTYFTVWSSSSRFWTEKYKNVDGVATPTGERLVSSEFVEAFAAQTELLTGMLPPELAAAYPDLHYAFLSQDRLGLLTIDKQNYAQFAGMRDKLQERLAFIGDKFTANSIRGWHHIFKTQDDVVGAGIDTMLKFWLAGMPDSIQDRLRALGNAQLSAKIRDLIWVGATDETLTNCWGVVGGDFRLRLAGMKSAVNDLENGVPALVRPHNGKLALFAGALDVAPIWNASTVVGATPISDSGIVFTFRKNGQVYAGVISKTPPQGAYKTRELDPDTAYVYLILVTGQSLAATQAGPSVVTHDASLDGSALMFTGEGQDRGLVFGENLDPTKLGAMTDLDSPVQARGPGAVQHILRTCRDNNIAMPIFATRTHAKGGAFYSELKKGTPTFDAGMTAAKEFARQVLGMGKKPVIPAEIISHGEADSARVTAIGQYYGDANEWTNDLQSGIQATTGQAQKPIIFIDQLGSRVRTVSPGSGDVIYGDFIAQDQWQLSLDRADVVLSTPKYPMNRLYPLDQQHLLQRGYSWLDEYVGQAIYWTFFDPNNTTRRKWNPVQPKKFTVIGNILRGEFETTPLGYPLTIDNDTLGAAPFAGLDFEKGTAVANHFEQVDDFTFEWGLNHAPTAGDFIRLGFNATDTGGFPPPYDNWIFPLVNIRDTSPLMSKYSAQHMWNWSVLARMPV